MNSALANDYTIHDTDSKTEQSRSGVLGFVIVLFKAMGISLPGTRRYTLYCHNRFLAGYGL